MEDQDNNNQPSEQANEPTTPIPQTVDTATVKRQALAALAPLLGSLQTNPERKFEICMSAMRFTDDASLAAVALDAALAIEDNGPKAEALVELINEIDYLESNAK